MEAKSRGRFAYDETCGPEQVILWPARCVSASTGQWPAVTVDNGAFLTEDAGVPGSGDGGGAGRDAKFGVNVYEVRFHGRIADVQS